MWNWLKIEKNYTILTPLRDALENKNIKMLDELDSKININREDLNFNFDYSCAIRDSLIHKQDILIFNEILKLCNCDLTNTKLGISKNFQKNDESFYSHLEILNDLKTELASIEKTFVFGDPINFDIENLKFNIKIQEEVLFQWRTHEMKYRMPKFMVCDENHNPSFFLFQSFNIDDLTDYVGENFQVLNIFNLHFSSYYLNILFLLLNIIVVIVPVLVSVAFLTLLERKIMATIQRRRGPNIVGFFGLLQPFADALKLLTKEFNIPARSFDSLVLLTPMLSLLFTTSCFALIPFGYSYLTYTVNSVSTLYIMAISSLNVYSIIMAGWASKSAYAFLGSLRASAQFISYEVSLTLNIMAIFLVSGSFDLVEIFYIQEATIPNIFCLFPIFLLYLVGIISETNRTPFDLAEAESELVAGYGVEFSAVGFTYFFLAEYSSIILYCLLTIIFFFGGLIDIIFLPIDLIVNLINCNSLDIIVIGCKYFVFGCEVVFILSFFIYVRATYARYRFDQLMKLNWKNLLLISLALDVFVSGFIYITQYI